MLHQQDQHKEDDPDGDEATSHLNLAEYDYDSEESDNVIIGKMQADLQDLEWRVKARLDDFEALIKREGERYRNEVDHGNK